MTDQVRGYLRAVEVARRVVRDPGVYLLRFPFNLLPARWFLSEPAIKILTTALCTGFSTGGTVPAKPPLLRVVLARNLQVGDLIDGKRPVLEVHHRFDDRRYRVRVRTDVSEETCSPDRAFHVKRTP